MTGWSLGACNVGVGSRDYGDLRIVLVCLLPLPVITFSNINYIAGPLL